MDGLVLYQDWKPIRTHFPEGRIIVVDIPKPANTNVTPGDSNDEVNPTPKQVVTINFERHLEIDRSFQDRHVRTEHVAFATHAIELARVAKETRPLDARFIRGSNDIAPEFLDYVRPLVGKLPKAARLADHPFNAG